MTNSDFVLVLGNKNLSSWSLRPWLLMRHAGIAFDEQVILFEDEGWREKISATSPTRKVPALRHKRNGEDLLLWDSLAIAEYIAELFPEKTLWPEAPAARAVARAVSAEMHSGFASLRKEMSMNVAARHPRRAVSREAQADIDRVQAILADCRKRFGAEGPFLFGRFSIADAMYAPVVWRFRTYDVPVIAEARTWYETMLGLEAMLEWERDAHAEVDAARPRPGTAEHASAQHVFAVIFTNQHPSTPTGHALEGYEDLAAAMVELASKQPGFLGLESARSADGSAITVSYWESMEAIASWKTQTENQRAQQLGRNKFYANYEVRACTVERGNKYSRSQSRNFKAAPDVNLPK